MFLVAFKETYPKLEEFNRVVGNLELLWDVLIWTAVGIAVFFIWMIFSYWHNRGKKDFMAARMTRKIPLINGYLRDLGFADSTSAAARMIRGKVPISDALRQAAEATTLPEVSQYWEESNEDLKRGVVLGAALDRPPLTKSERLELAGVSDLSQVGTVMESISEMRQQASKSKHSLIVWLAFGLSGLYLVVAFGSAIYALTVMNMSMDSMMGSLTAG